METKELTKSSEVIKEVDSVEIIRCSKENLSMNISLYNLTWRNVRLLEDVLSKFIATEELPLKDWTEKQKKEQHISYLMHPTIKLRDLIVEAIIKTEPNWKSIYQKQ